MKMGKRLKKTIKQMGYTQAEIATALKVKTTSVNNWCNDYNYPTADKIYKLCIILGISADYLLGLE